MSRTHLTESTNEAVIPPTACLLLSASTGGGATRIGGARPTACGASRIRSETLRKAGRGRQDLVRADGGHLHRLALGCRARSVAQPVVVTSGWGGGAPVSDHAEVAGIGRRQVTPLRDDSRSYEAVKSAPGRPEIMATDDRHVQAGHRRRCPNSGRQERSTVFTGSKSVKCWTTIPMAPSHVATAHLGFENLVSPRGSTEAVAALLTKEGRCLMKALWPRGKDVRPANGSRHSYLPSLGL